MSTALPPRRQAPFSTHRSPATIARVNIGS
jgi:hypothetical protein